MNYVFQLHLPEDLIFVDNYQTTLMVSTRLTYHFYYTSARWYRWTNYMKYHLSCP